MISKWLFCNITKDDRTLVPKFGCKRFESLKGTDDRKRLGEEPKEKACLDLHSCRHIVQNQFEFNFLIFIAFKSHSKE
jgi:hypothetical protein